MGFHKECLQIPQMTMAYHKQKPSLARLDHTFHLPRRRRPAEQPSCRSKCSAAMHRFARCMRLCSMSCLPYFLMLERVSTNAFDPNDQSDVGPASKATNIDPMSPKQSACCVNSSKRLTFSISHSCIVITILDDGIDGRRNDSSDSGSDSGSGSVGVGSMECSIG